MYDFKVHKSPKKASVTVGVDQLEEESSRELLGVTLCPPTLHTVAKLYILFRQNVIESGGVVVHSSLCYMLAWKLRYLVSSRLLRGRRSWRS